MGVNLKQGYFGTPPVVTDGLTLYLDAGSRKSYASGSTTWNDLSGNGYNATGVNTPGFSTNNQGTTVLNGTNQRFTLPAGVTVSATAGFTLSCTYRMTAPVTEAILFQVGLSTGTSGYIIDFITNASYTPFSVGVNGGTTVRPSTLPLSAATGSWHNITVTNDGGGLNAVASTGIYLDGVSLPLTTGNAFSGITNTSVIGALNGTSRFVNGNVAQFLVYNKALSAGEVQQNYNALKARFGLS